MRKDPTRLLLARPGILTFLNPVTVARPWQSFSANPNTKFRNLAKNSFFWFFVVMY
jgi:hypothetical protein